MSIAIGPGMFNMTEVIRLYIRWDRMWFMALSHSLSLSLSPSPSLSLFQRQWLGQARVVLQLESHLHTAVTRVDEVHCRDGWTQNRS